MPFSDDELKDIVQEIRADPNYFSKTDSILNRCSFRHIDAKRFDDSAVDNLTENELQFSIIGRIIRKTTYLQPEGVYLPSGVVHPTREGKSAFLSSRLKVSLAPPKEVLDARTIKDDWVRYQTTMKQLINSAVVQKGDTQYWSPYRRDKNVFSMNHLLISSKDMEPDGKFPEGTQGQAREPISVRNGITLSFSGEITNDPIEDAGGVGLPELEKNLEKQIDKLMDIKDWPAGPEWHIMADRFQETHHINPLPAFDDEYELIMPRFYEAKLLGAVVHARFTLSRFDIRGDHVFMCNIVELQVLKPPLAGATVRKKRNLMDLIMDKKRKRGRLA